MKARTFEHRIGQLYPSGGIRDDEMQKMAPDSLRFITTRLPFRSTDLSSNAGLSKQLGTHAGLLSDAQVDLIAFNCTTGSLVGGSDTINKQIYDATGIESVTTIEAVMEALHASEMRRVILMTPYRTEVIKAEIEFLEASGYQVVNSIGIPCDDPVSQGLIPSEVWYGLACSVKGQDFDGVLASCAGIEIADVIQSIEDAIERPIITSNQALLWACLHRLYIPSRPQIYGALLRGDFDDATNRVLRLEC